MIIIAGCGYVGAPLADLLHAAGQRVLGLTHSPESAARLRAAHPWPVAACDITSPDSLAAIAASLDPAHPVTTVVHCASSGRGGADAYRAVYWQGLENLVTAFPSARPLFTSSTSVYAQTDGTTVTEESPAEPPRETGRLLRQAEDLALARGGTVARLAGIYGPGRNAFVNLDKGTARRIIKPGQMFNRIRVEDIGRAIAAAARTRLDGPLNVTDDEPAPPQLPIEWAARLMGIEPPPEVPYDEAEFSPLARSFWGESKQVGNARLRSLIGDLAYPTYREGLTQLWKTDTWRGDPQDREDASPKFRR